MQQQPYQDLVNKIKLISIALLAAVLCASGSFGGTLISGPVKSTDAARNFLTNETVVGMRAQIGVGSTKVTISSKGIANGLATRANNGCQFGPDTPGTTTSGINEAMNFLLRNGNGDNGVPPPGGGRIEMEAGTYQCTGQILYSNRFSNPILMEGLADLPSVIINYKGHTNFFQTTAPEGLGKLGLYCSGIVWSMEAVETNRIFKVLDPLNFVFYNCFFTSWGFVTNGGLTGEVAPGFSTAHNAGVIAFEIGDPNHGGDLTSGLVEFHNCRFWDIAAGGFGTTDHIWFYDCSFALMGNSDRFNSGSNMWSYGNSYVEPDSLYAFHPGWVNLSLWGDIRFDACSWYYQFVALINCKKSLGGRPTFKNIAQASLEGANWLVLQMDDVTDTGVEIESQPTDTMLSHIGTIEKSTGTLREAYPPQTKFIGPGYMYGSTNVLSADITGLTSLGLVGVASADAAVKQQVAIGALGGRNILQGYTLLDNISVGVSYDASSATVSGGTDSGINGTYRFMGFVQGPLGASRAWTNSTYVILQVDDDSGGLGGGFYRRTDMTNYATELYSIATPVKWADNAYVPIAGTYQVSHGTNSAPTVAITLTTNLNYIVKLKTDQLTVTSKSTNSASFDKIGYSVGNAFMPGSPNTLKTNENRRSLWTMGFKNASATSPSTQITVKTYMPGAVVTNQYLLTIVDDGGQSDFISALNVPMEPGEVLFWLCAPANSASLENFPYSHAARF